MLPAPVEFDWMDEAVNLLWTDMLLDVHYHVVVNWQPQHKRKDVVWTGFPALSLFSLFVALS